MTSRKLVGANERPFRPQVLYSVFSSPHNYSQRLTTPNCSNRAQKATTQSYRNLLFTHLCFPTLSSNLKIYCYFWSPVWILTHGAYTAVLSPAVFINCWLTQELLFLPQLSSWWHITQPPHLDLTLNVKRSSDSIPFTEKQSEMTLCRKGKLVFRHVAGKYAEKQISAPVSETVHCKVI